MQRRILGTARGNPLARSSDNAFLRQKKLRRFKTHMAQKHAAKRLFVHRVDPGDVGALGDGKLPRAYVAPLQPPTVTVPRLRPNQDKLLKTALMAMTSGKLRF